MAAARYTQIHLVCHGEPEGTRGRHRLPLSAAGIEQAQRVADHLALRRPSALYASPLRPAWETAEIIGLRLGFTPNLRAELRGDRRFHGDDPARAGACVWRELERLARLHRGEHLVCVTDAAVIGATARRIWEPSSAALEEMEIGFCSVWTLAVIGRHVGLRHLDYSEIAARGPALA